MLQLVKAFPTLQDMAIVDGQRMPITDLHVHLKFH